MVTLTLKLKEEQKIKYANVTTITRFGKTGQKKTVKKEFAGIVLKTGVNEIADKVYYRIEKSPWFVLLVGRKDIVVTNIPKKKAKKDEPVKTNEGKVAPVKVSIKK